MNIDEVKKKIRSLKYDSDEVDFAYRKVFVPTKSDEEKLQQLSFFPVFYDKKTDMLYFIYSDSSKLMDIKNYLNTRYPKLYETIQMPNVIVNSFVNHFLTEIQDVKLKEKTDIVIDDNAKIVQQANTMILDAIKKNTSDIHIEVFAHRAQVRFRINGIMTVYREMRPQEAVSLIRTFLNFAQLDVSDLVPPQDGMFQKIINGQRYSFRVNAIGVFTPTGYSTPTLVIRILYKNKSKKLENLGFEPAQLEAFEKMTMREGIIVITGPTGSGKTTTLYALLDHLDLSGRKVISVEDPPEIPSEKVTQIKIMPERNITWTTALQNALRMDPDILLVGEIRTREAAEIAMQAAITGHTVLTTIHTNGVESIVERFVQIAGKDSPTVNAQTLSYSLIGLVSQRLVKKIKYPVMVPIDNETKKKLELLGILNKVRNPYFAPDGTKTNELAFKGYDMSENGRTVIAEVVANDAEFIRVLRKEDPIIIREYLDTRENHITLVDHAIKKVNRGEISLLDVMPYIADAKVNSRH